MTQETRMSWPKRVLAALFILAVVAIVAASLRPAKPQPVSVQVTTVERGAVSRSVTATGKLQPATEIKVSSNLSGDLLELTVQEGDAVEKGQLLARIDARRYAAQVKQQEAVRQSAVADLALARVQLERVTAERDRVQRLVGSESASAAELERAEADVATERARVQSVQERLAQTDAALAEARHFLSLTTLYAPLDGIVTSRQKQVGERVRGSDFSEDVILVIATLSAMEVKVEVGEHEVVYLHERDRAEVEIDALPEKKWPAEVVEIAKTALVKYAGTESEVITFPVRLTLLATAPKALPGMSAQAVITTDTHENALKVPIQAVTARPAKPSGDKGEAVAEAGPPVAAVTDVRPPRAPANKPMRKVVFVVEEGVARLREVEVGLANENEIEITKGLQQGEKVITAPYRALSRELEDGRLVRVEEPKAAAGKPKTES